MKLTLLHLGLLLIAIAGAGGGVLGAGLAYLARDQATWAHALAGAGIGGGVSTLLATFIMTLSNMDGPEWTKVVYQSPPRPAKPQWAAADDLSDR